MANQRMDIPNKLYVNGVEITGGGGAYPWRGTWVTATAYVINDCVEHNGSGYVCIADHTSDVFATDLAAGDWELLVSKGIDGTNGTNGTNGTDGTNGTNGTNGLDGTQYPWQEAWLTGTAYVLNDCVEHNGSGYVCITAHTSGDFATDLAANKWSLLVQGVTTPTTITGKALVIDGNVNIAEFPIGANEYATLEVRYWARTTDGTDQEVTSGINVLEVADKAGTMDTNYQEVKNGAKTHGGFLGNITVTLVKDEPNDKVYINVAQSTNGFTPTSGTVDLEITKNWQNKTITVL